jgi:regulator of RNase E activity RraA
MSNAVTAEQAREWFSSAVLADVLDTLGQRRAVLPSSLRSLDPSWKVSGRAATLSMHPVSAEPEHLYAVEMECIDALRAGDVLVVTTHGDQSSAVWGELLSTSARAHGAVGAVIDGLTRDAARILTMDFPVFAAGFSPLDSRGRIEGASYGEPIEVGACLIQPGDWIFGDIDGIVAIPAALVETVFAAARIKVQGESRVREELASGRSIRAVFGEHKIL